METLSLYDIQHLNQCIQQLYSFHDLATFGIDALKIVDRLVPSDFPLFNLTNARTCEIEDICLPGAPELTPQIQEAKGLYLSEHPIAQNMGLAVNGIYKISDFATEQELHCLEGIYHQFLRLLDTEDQMFLYLPNDRADSWDRLVQAEIIIAGFILGRSERNFIERDRLILNLVRPHLFQAYINAQKYQQLQDNICQLRRSINSLDGIILDGQGSIESISTQSMLWLETYFVKSTCSMQLPDLLWSWVKHQVNCCSENPDSFATLSPLLIHQDGGQLVIRLVIEKPGERYLLLLEEQLQTPSLLSSIKILGLSDRETEVLGWIIQGKDNKSIAIQMNISASTVRKHLENIYRKLGVQSRTEASAKAIKTLSFGHSLPLRY